MEKSFESSSDSDSNSSTSWVFVSDNSPPAESAMNTFHLDCSREPIQELTEQDLVTNSDIESDTDGVSVISESDISNEKNDTCDITSEFKYVVDEYEDFETITENIFVPKKVDKSLITEAKKFLRSSNLVGVGVVLTAVFLGSYTFKKIIIQDTSDLYSQNFIIDKIDKSEHNFICQNLANLDRKLEEIVDLTISCTYKDKNKNLIENKEIIKCVKVKYEMKHRAPGNKVNSHISKIEEFSNDDSGTFKVETKQNIIKDKHNCKNKDQKHEDEQVTSKLKKLKLKPVLTPKPPKIVNEDKRYKDYQKKFKNYKHEKKLVFNSNRKKNHTSKNELGNRDGEWYTNLHKGRQLSRKHTDTLDFYVNKKRNKNQWYFKWMNSREESRRKNIYKPYSRYLNI